MKRQFGWDLPPGVSVKDIEDAQESIEDEEIESIRIAIRARQRQAISGPSVSPFTN
jgi:hypothetical protein